MKSMTGFGRGEAAGESFHCTVEASSVNRKQLEVVVNVPRELAACENALRAQATAAISRGRLNVSVRVDTAGTAGKEQMTVNTTLVSEYLAAANKLKGDLGLHGALTLSEALRLPGVVEYQRTEVMAEAAQPVIEAALAVALKQLVDMRRTEGEALLQDVRQHLSKVEQLLTEIESRAASVVDLHHKALHQRLTAFGLVVDLQDERLVKEIVLLADKCDISEETSRARSHLAQFESYLVSDESVGRASDFLTQELFREFNTMGSKANNAGLSHLVVTAKTEIEKVREQVQNVE